MYFARFMLYKKFPCPFIFCWSSLVVTCLLELDPPAFLSLVSFYVIVALILPTHILNKLAPCSLYKDSCIYVKMELAPTSNLLPEFVDQSQQESSSNTNLRASEALNSVNITNFLIALLGFFMLARGF